MRKATPAGSNTRRSTSQASPVPSAWVCPFHTSLARRIHDGATPSFWHEAIDWLEGLPGPSWLAYAAASVVGVGLSFASTAFEPTPPAVEPLAVDDYLSLHQQGRLQVCMLERHAWFWSRSTERDYEVIWAHLQEGLEQGFTQPAVLDGWLRLRLQYPTATLLATLAGHTQQERLDSLRQHWRNDHC